MKSMRLATYLGAIGFALGIPALGQDNALPASEEVTDQTSPEILSVEKDPNKGVSPALIEARKLVIGLGAVSYTHLTLPTNREV